MRSLRGDGLFKAHSTRETLKGWVPPFTMRSAYEIRDLSKALSQRTPGIRRQGVDAGVTPLITAKALKGPVLPSLPTGLYRDGCPSQKRDSLLLTAEQGPSDLQVPVLDGSLDLFCQQLE